MLLSAGGAEEALPLLADARRAFETIAKDRKTEAALGMTSACIIERGDCLAALGRLDEAAVAYEESIALAEQRGAHRVVAVCKGQLGTVRNHKRRYREALVAHAEARERFTQLGEPGSVASSWHLTGMAYVGAGQPEAAEEAYRKSLAINVRLSNAAGQAATLNQLGSLYVDVPGRLEEAAASHRQAADKYVEIGDARSEGLVRSNLANTLRKLGHLDEARQEVLRAIECKAPFGHAAAPWTTWSILADIETDAGHAAAAAEATAKAGVCYLAYRRDGGESHSGSGRLAHAVTQLLCAGTPAEASALLQQLAADPEVADLHPFIQALQAIVAGSRDRRLAESPGLDFTMAAEVLLLIETLEAR